jgi:hypothetical protein
VAHRPGKLHGNADALSRIGLEDEPKVGTAMTHTTRPSALVPELWCTEWNMDKIAHEQATYVQT